jgi:sigma-B regulation protein RsbU (phosphoserine phosphatase)
MTAETHIAEEETRRISELDRLELMYTQPEEVFDRITAQLADIFGAQAAMMNLIDSENQYAKSIAGIPEGVLGSRIMPRKGSLCGYVVAHNEPMIVEDLLEDARFRDLPIVKEKGVRFYAGAPLHSDNGEAIGSLCVIDVVPHKITLRERKLLRLVADEVMTEVKLRNVSRQLLDHTRSMQRDLHAARSVQRFMLPPQRQEGKGYALWHFYHPVDAIGGDFLDATIRADGSLAAVLADVSGHGASAALTSAMVKSVFQNTAAHARRPNELLSSLHNGLGGSISTGQFITAAAAIYDPATSSAYLASAGHPAAILLREGKARVLQTVTDLPLLIEPDQKYLNQTEVPLRPGDRVVLYTDGATEALNLSGDMLDPQGVMQFMETEAHQPAETFLPALFRDIRMYADGKLHDDVALICLDVT